MFHFSLAIVLIIAGTLLVFYTRFKNRVDSNLPVAFFSALLIYTTLSGEMIPLWLTYVGLAVSALLRFEFLNQLFARIFKIAEMCILTGVLYECTIWVLGR